MLRRARVSVVVAVLVACAVPTTAPGAGVAGDDPLTSPRTRWFREAKFGMFVHWGLYAVPAGYYRGRQIGGIGEWIMNNAKIPVSEYEQYAREFDAASYDAREFVRVAKAAGMRYLVITSKHHDGFSMFDTKTNGYDIVDATPYGRDPMKSLAEACRAEGITFCFYYSIMDWHHPDANDRGAERYIPQMKEQLRELVTTYDPAMLWFDGEWVGWWTAERGRELEAFLREMKPGIVVNNRIGKRSTTDGDYETPEQEIPHAAMGTRLWETCMTLNDTWGFKRDDDRWKQPADVIRKLSDIASKGGNFLLNVGPDAHGVIPADSVRILEEVGAWLKVNGEAIYATTYAPIATPSWGRITRSGDKLYLIVFDWPDTATPLRLRLTNPVRRARVLTTRAAVRVEPRGEEGCDLYVPGNAPGPHASVIVVEFRGELVAAKTLAEKTAEGIPIPAAADGSITLPAHGAKLVGRSLRHEGPEEAGNVGFWTERGEYVEWFVAPAPGRYAVALTYACAAEYGGEFVLAVGAETLRGEAVPTGEWQTYRTLELGTVTVPAGRSSVTVKPDGRFSRALMNLKGVVLRPRQQP